MIQFEDEARLLLWVKENLILDLKTDTEQYKYEDGGYVRVEAKVKLNGVTVLEESDSVWVKQL
jgi:hypothetical protein